METSSYEPLIEVIKSIHEKLSYLNETNMNNLKNNVTITRINIYQRMLSIMKEVQYIQKTEKAAKGLPYKFITHDQVTGKLHFPMVKYGVYTKTDIIECTQTGNRTFVKVKISFINADDPKDIIEVNSYGYGIDGQDKGIGKAISYATKMALLKNFMLETGEDPEKDNVDYNEDNEVEKEKIQFISTAQVDNLRDIVKPLSIERYNVLLDSLKITSLKEVPFDKFVTTAKFLKNFVSKHTNNGENL